MWYEDNKELYINEMQYIRRNYPKLHFSIEEDILYLKGEFEFVAVFNKVEIKDSYEVEIKFPFNYPKEIPSVKEVAGKIPKDYHTNPDGNLCLGVETDLYLIFQNNRSIENFFEKILIHYFYRYSFIKKYNKEPFEDYSHGTKGKIEFYRKHFKTENIDIIKIMLINILRKKYSKNKKCICGSNKKLRKCHGNRVKSIIKKVPKDIIEIDYKEVDLYGKKKV